MGTACYPKILLCLASNKIEFDSDYQTFSLQDFKKSFFSSEIIEKSLREEMRRHLFPRATPLKIGDDFHAPSCILLGLPSQRKPKGYS